VDTVTKGAQAAQTEHEVVGAFLLSCERSCFGRFPSCGQHDQQLRHAVNHHRKSKQHQPRAPQRGKISIPRGFGESLAMTAAFV